MAVPVYESSYADGAAVDAALDLAVTALQPAALGTAAAKNIPAAGNASATEVVYGSDTRLTDTRDPKTHASSHAAGQADAVTPTAIGLGNVTNQTQHILHGFPNRTATTLAFDNGSHVFTLGVATTATVFINGVPYTIASPGLTVDLDDKPSLSVGLWYLWAEVSGNAVVLNAAKDPWSITNLAAIPVATVYWGGAAGAIHDERHSSQRNLATHAWQHMTVGARIPNDGSFAQTYPTIAQSKIELIAGYLWDEDLTTEISTAKGKLVRNWYETASGVWTWADGTDNAGNDRPYIWNSGTSRVRFAKSDSSYALTDFQAGAYTPVFVYASNDIARPIYVVTPSGTNNNLSLANARLVAAPTLPFAPELKLLWKWIIKGDGTYTEAVDYRSSASLPGGGVTAPSALSVSFSPAGHLAALNVQAALEELDAEKPQLVTAPAAADSTGTAGQMAYADGFLYVCIAPNTWQRAVLATWS